jgi:hypothetical protein
MTEATSKRDLNAIFSALAMPDSLSTWWHPNRPKDNPFYDIPYSIVIDFDSQATHNFRFEIDFDIYTKFALLVKKVRIFGDNGTAYGFEVDFIETADLYCMRTLIDLYDRQEIIKLSFQPLDAQGNPFNPQMAFQEDVKLAALHPISFEWACGYRTAWLRDNT